jgi:ribonucleotide monophosphatase NagD (HAD superfamily)
MTSGEALWRVFATGATAAKSLCVIEGKAGDADHWAQELPVEIMHDLTAADAILLMGLPDGTAPDAYDAPFETARAANLPLYCSNPDFKSPRGGGTYVMSPGALADRYAQMGGTVHLFGKPHLPVFTAIQQALDCPPDRILMVGDSMHHDIAGAQTAGWASLLIRGGVHAPEISEADAATDIAMLARGHTMPAPDFSLPDLR